MAAAVREILNNLNRYYDFPGKKTLHSEAGRDRLKLSQAFLTKITAGQSGLGNLSSTGASGLPAFPI